MSDNQLSNKLKLAYEIISKFPQGKGAFTSQDDEQFNAFKQIFRDIPALKEIPPNFRLKVIQVLIP